MLAGRFARLVATVSSRAPLQRLCQQIEHVHKLLILIELKRRGHARLCEYLFGFGKFLSRFRDRSAVERIAPGSRSLALPGKASERTAKPVSQCRFISGERLFCHSERSRGISNFFGREMVGNISVRAGLAYSPT